VCGGDIAILEREGLPERANHIGDRLGGALRALVDDGAAVAPAGVGAIWAVDVGGDARPLRDRMLDAGVVVRPIGDRLAMCPPLTITDDEIDHLVDVLAASL
jgi:putrescine---pyruvate transaminase